MRKCIFFALLLCVVAAGVAEAGQFRIGAHDMQRKGSRPHGWRESRLEIINHDDRGYAIDVDYRRNRLTFEHRSHGDIYIPGNSSITLVFDDDDNWQIFGDDESLEIEMRDGRTTTLRLETRFSRNQVGLFGSIDYGRYRSTKQLFRYADRSIRPGPTRSRAAPPPPARPQVHNPGPSQPTPQRLPAQSPTSPSPQPPRNDSRGPSLGAIVGGAIDSLIDDKPGPRR